MTTCPPSPAQQSVPRPHKHKQRAFRAAGLPQRCRDRTTREGILGVSCRHLSKARQLDYECSSHIRHFYPAFQATQPAKLDPIVFDLRFPSSPIRSSLFALLQIFLSYTLEDLRVLRHAHADASPRPKSSARSTDGLPSSPNQLLAIPCWFVSGQARAACADIACVFSPQE
ncbi:hypothetical protein H4582DRAFT_1101672 [Lactarius indigo]|nr:hypothetical protein H4582DRAFT_1101672 [Lactarius indigo]